MTAIASDVENGRMVDTQAILDFVTAGDARFTLVSTATGARYTYRVQASDSGEVWFVGLLTGPDNTHDYRYLGILSARNGRLRFRWTGKSVAGQGAASVRAIEWYVRRLAGGEDVSAVEFYHLGRCGRCGRDLTDPESIRVGLGPVCREAML